MRLPEHTRNKPKPVFLYCGPYTMTHCHITVDVFHWYVDILTWKVYKVD